ncbi:DNA ligase (NAD(+)) [Treponema primitia ZAS-2]|uniref:DNA ligase n=1 Tax=Treponema primitia (strain ATCC BAA-887 / DSM 12427 / ZAS-2) TaxID=545694 RepID=F5YR93_TREPZ|nr:NAD-dependent DNA ligase LigA [Treponema primitia]AEF85331.1 DNA ligase (NAD(+)) [Treponema primitia ZAS-2]
MTRKDDRAAALERLIKGYQDSYYNGEAEISDAEFDALWDELKGLKPDSAVLLRVGEDNIDGFPKARHLIPMGSQEKAANPLEFRAWAEKMAPPSFVVQYKLDGASLELQYEKGKLLRAITRGDGVIGDEITRNARRMSGVAAELDIPFSGGIRGEVVMTHQVWREKYADKANCRNAANGLMRRKDGVGCEDLSLIAYDAAAKDDDSYFTDELSKIAWLKDRGFSVTETREFATAEDVIVYREKIAEERKGLSVDIDGLVIKDPRTDMTDLRRARPEMQIAFKFDLEVAVSVLREVVWSKSGATYTPIGIVDPVRLAGTTVQRANLNNPDMIRGMGLKIGSPVRVVKRGEIIPKIEGLAPALPAGNDAVEETDISFPVECETCGTELVDIGTRLYCPNLGCPKRLLHRLEKWVSVLDIRELGEKLIYQLFETERVRQISELYTLETAELSELERMGEQSAAKVVRHIRTKRDLSLAAFIAGFDFDGVGETIMEKVTAAGFDTLEKIRSASVEKLAEVYGLGEITARTIVEGLADTGEEMDRILANGVISIAAPPRAEDQPLQGCSFCFTGELSSMKRNQAEEKVKTLGGSSKSSVVKDLSFLVTNDPGSGSAKNAKARSLGIPIIDEEGFLAILADPAKVKAYSPAGGVGALQGELF